MARFEVAVRSPIAFSRWTSDDVPAPSLRDILGTGPETVGIKFEERLFVWHAFPAEDAGIGVGREEWGPSVTVVVQDDDDERRAADDLQRFLSALAFHLHHPAEAVSYGGSGETDPYHPAVVRAERSHVGWMLAPPPSKIVVRPEANLGVALAYFREGLNAGSPFYRFLALWNALDATFSVNRNAAQRDAFIRSFAPQAQKAWDHRYPFPSDLATALRDDSRHAIAHVLRDPGARQVNPDSGSDRARLTMEAGALKWIAEAAIEHEYPGAVRTEMLYG